MASPKRRWTRVGNRIAVGMYRRSGGRLFGIRGRVRVLMITAPGRRTGVPRTTCVRYLDTPDGLVVWGTASGARHDPDWFENLRRADTVGVQVGADRFEARARELLGAARDAMWNEVVLVREPGVARYARRAGRTIPVAVLEPIAAATAEGRP